MRLLSYLFPQKIISVSSKFNGKIDVYESFGKKYLEVGGLMQSGSFVERIFRKGIEKLKVDKKDIKNILIIGLGGGSVARVFQKLFPKAHLTGIEIDPVMVELGRKFLRLDEVTHLEVKTADIFKKPVSQKPVFDLIFVDVYQGYSVPRVQEEAGFLRYLASLTKKNGLLVFNRLYFRKHISEANEFLDKLQKIFQDIKRVKVYSNLLIQVKP